MNTKYRTKFEAALDKRDAVKAAEENGQVADSMEARKALIARMHAGELTLEQVQKGLVKIKRGAKAAGKTTRAQAFRHG